MTDWRLEEFLQFSSFQNFVGKEMGYSTSPLSGFAAEPAIDEN